MSRRYKGRLSYYQWLLEIVSAEWLNNSYLLMLKDLYNTKFEWFVPNDDNRAKDAVQLRSEYTGAIEEYTTVSVLEVLITLAGHMDDMLFEIEYGERLDKWFWELICNLGLDNYDDDHYDSMEVDLIIANFVARRYDKWGHGGAFPLSKVSQNRNRKCHRDQRRVELWYQMSAYIDENHVL